MLKGTANIITYIKQKEAGKTKWYGMEIKTKLLTKSTLHKGTYRQSARLSFTT